MPFLEITECVSCPFVYTSGRDKQGNQTGDDMFYVRCDHEDQDNTEGFVAKMKNMHDNIYFNCPI